MQQTFNYCDEKFADIQILRYRMKGFEQMSLKKKMYIYCLAKATLCGRDITTDQFGKYNLRIRRLLEAVYVLYNGNRDDADFRAMTVYLKRIWFSNGIYHHYGCEKFEPGFSEQFLRKTVAEISQQLVTRLNLDGSEALDTL